MKRVISIKSPILWLATFVVCGGAAYLVARAEEKGADEPEAHRTAGAKSPRRAGQIGKGSASRPSQADWKSDRSPGGAGEAGAWMRIPLSWMGHCRQEVGSRKIHQMLGLEYAKSEELMKAAKDAKAAGKKKQIEGIADFELSEGETLRLPALEDEAIRALSSEVIGILPDKLSAAERELVGFLMEREIRADYGQALDVTLVFSGGISTKDVAHLPAHLLGFHFAVRPSGYEGDDRTMHYSPIGGGRLDFLKLDPAVTNEGRNPLK